MLWLALHLNALPLEALLASLPADLRGDGAAGTARCVVEQRRVLYADARACAAGVRVGMSAASAAALLPGLQLLQRDVIREANFVERLALVASPYTPSLVLEPDGVLLEVASCLRLFGGLQGLGRSLRQRVGESGVNGLQMALAPSARAAALLARLAPVGGTRQRTLSSSAGPRARPKAAPASSWAQKIQQRLDALPLAPVLAAWRWPPRTVEFLHGIGCRTLADVRALPRAGLQRREGGALLQRLAETYGEAPDPRMWFTPPPRFEMGLELLERADDAGRLVFAAQRLVQPLAGWLAQQWLAATRLALHLRHETSRRRILPDTVLRIGLADATRDPAQINLLLSEKLQRLELLAPVYALTLSVEECVSCSGKALALWNDDGCTAGAGLLALIDRLGARLGAERVQRLGLQADHRPELATRVRPAFEAEAVQPGPRPEAVSSEGSARPTWLLPQPLRLHEQAGRPLHGGPLRLRSRAERIEAGWFDGEPVSRDYHLAEGADHRWRWIFRERRSDGAQWYLHGLFG